jgi:hypothetical protein
VRWEARDEVGWMGGGRAKKERIGWGEDEGKAVLHKTRSHDLMNELAWLLELRVGVSSPSRSL